MSKDLVLTVVLKDLTLFFRNRFFALVTALGLVAYVAIYFILPGSVDERLVIGFYAPGLPPEIVEDLAQEGVDIRLKASEDALKLAIEAGDFDTGIVLPPDWAQRLAVGEKDEVKIYFTADFPEDLKGSYVILIQELAYLVSGQALNIEVDEEIMGFDRVGAQVPPRERMLPLLAVFVLLTETMGLASLITSEIQGGTLRALLTTPLRVEGLFLGKALTGIGLTFVQVMLLLGVTGGLKAQPAVILVSVLLGSVLVTGIGFLMATFAKDMLSVLGWGMLFMILLAIPAFGILIPGTVSEWVQVLPTYYLVDTVYRTVNFDAGWGDVAGNLLTLLAISVAILVLGIAGLRRKFA